MRRRELVCIAVGACVDSVPLGTADVWCLCSASSFLHYLCPALQNVSMCYAWFVGCKRAIVLHIGIRIVIMLMLIADKMQARRLFEYSVNLNDKRESGRLTNNSQLERWRVLSQHYGSLLTIGSHSKNHCKKATEKKNRQQCHRAGMDSSPHTGRCLSHRLTKRDNWWANGMRWVKYEREKHTGPEIAS